MPNNSAGTTIVATPALAAMSSTAVPVDTSVPMDQPAASATPVAPLPTPVSTTPPMPVVPPLADDGIDETAAADAAAKARVAASNAAKAAAPVVPDLKKAAHTAVNPAAVAAPDIPPAPTVRDAPMPLDFEREDVVAETNAVLAEVVHKIGEAHNVLIALSSDPSVDEMAAAIGLSLYLDKLGKRATAIYSGSTPNALEFLKPEETFESSVDTLQDFVIALNKEKADHLRYKLDGDFVKIYITPYRSKISEKDLEFSYGDFNVDLVIALDVANGIDLDAALREHGRIMHDAVIVNITTGNPGKLAEIEWSDKTASSVSEMIARLLYRVNSKVTVDSDEATAFLTGIVAATNRFSNMRTAPNTMRVVARLMESGANQQLVAKNITPDVENEIFSLAGAKSKTGPEDPTKLSVHEDDGEAANVAADVVAADAATAAVDAADVALLNDLKAAEASLAGAAAEVTPEESKGPIKIGDNNEEIGGGSADVDSGTGAGVDSATGAADAGAPSVDASDVGGVDVGGSDIDAGADVGGSDVDASSSDVASVEGGVLDVNSGDAVGDADAGKEDTVTSTDVADAEREVPAPAKKNNDERLAATTEAEFSLKPDPDLTVEPELSFDMDSAENDGSELDVPVESEKESTPEPVPFPEAVPEPVTEPTPVSTPAPMPMPAPVPTPVSVPEPVAPEPVAVPAPSEPVPAPTPAPAPAPESRAHSETDMPGEGFISDKPEKVIQPPADMEMGLNGGLEGNKYGKMLEEALASAEMPPVMAQPAPMPAPTMPMMPTMPTPLPMPTAMPAGNPAMMNAPTVATAPEINGVPQINYMPMPGDATLPPPPTPPIDMNSPMPNTSVPVAAPTMPMPTAPMPAPMPMPPAPAVPPTPVLNEAVLPTVPIAPAAPAVTPPPTPLGAQPAMQDQVYAPQAADPGAFKIPGS